MLRQIVRVCVCLAAAALPLGVSAESYQDYYRDRGTSLPRVVSSDPAGKPYELDRRVGATADGSTLNMPREARREFEGRRQSELDARNAADVTRRKPDIKFNIRPPEMPKPVTAD